MNQAPINESQPIHRNQPLPGSALKKMMPSQKDVALPELTILIDQLDTALGDYAQAIEEKGKAPSQAVPVPEADLVGLSFNLERSIYQTNILFEKLKDSVSASSRERLTLHRDACVIFRVEFCHSNWSFFDDIHELTKQERGETKELSELKKSELSANIKDRVAETFEQLIASFFGQKYSFDKNSFVLKRDNRDMERGPGRTLSDGEKTAVAFCYFIACIHKKIKNTSDYEKIYLVFDDPITSMSYDFVFIIAQTLKNIRISKTGVVSINPDNFNKDHPRPCLLIFTHSSYFYNICVSNKVVNEISAFFLYKAGTVNKLSNFQNYVAPFEHQLREIFNVSDGTSEPTHTTGNAIRCVIEA